MMVIVDPLASSAYARSDAASSNFEAEAAGTPCDHSDTARIEDSCEAHDGALEQPYAAATAI